MIAAWMLWSIGVGLLLLVAGLAAEKLLEGRRRWVWTTVGVGTVVLTAVRLFATGAPGSENTSGDLLAVDALTATGTDAAGGTGTAAATSSPTFFPVTIPQDSILHALNQVLLLGWLVLSGGLVLWALVGVGRLLQRRRSWEPGMLQGQPVLWSRNMGPAIVGLFRPTVVLPSWVGDVEPSRQELILAHEGEHRRAGDGILRFAMASLLIAFPWNTFLWLQYRRLCMAIELDCDHRVVQSFPHGRWLYGDLLVRVGYRGGMHLGLGLTAFAERRSFLEKRIGKLLSEGPEIGVAKVAFLAFATLLVVGGAMWVPGLTEEAGVPEVAVQPVDAAPLAVVEFEHGVPLPPVALPGVPLPAVPLPVVPFRQGDGAPPLPANASVMERPQFVPHTTLPILADPQSIERTLEAEYPTALRDAGIGGTVVAYLFVNTDGRVSKIFMKTSSGHWELDRVAFRVAELAPFLPGTNEGTPVGMWIEIQVPFKP